MGRERRGKDLKPAVNRLYLLQAVSDVDYDLFHRIKKVRGYLSPGFVVAIVISQFSSLVGEINPLTAMRVVVHIVFLSQLKSSVIQSRIQ